MTTNGYIALHRQLRENSLWSDKPFSKGQAWVDLLLRVNHKESSLLVGNKTIELKPGETIWSIKKMASEWGWSRHKVSRALSALESAHMLRVKRTSKYTKLTVVNWQNYQISGHQTDIKRTSNGHQTDTNNNKINNNKKINKKVLAISKLEIEEELNAFIAHRAEIKSPVTAKALALIEKKLDKLYPNDTAMQVECINQSIENGWKGLFPVKSEPGPSKRKKTLLEKEVERLSQNHV